MALSNISRYILSIQNKTRVLLSEELDFLHFCLSIFEMRYNKNLTVEVTGADGFRNKHTVPLTMQLLIENVPKHNIISAECPMKVSVSVGEEGVLVSNPVRPKESGPASGIGHKLSPSNTTAKERFSGFLTTAAVLRPLFNTYEHQVSDSRGRAAGIPDACGQHIFHKAGIRIGRGRRFGKKAVEPIEKAAPELTVLSSYVPLESVSINPSKLGLKLKATAVLEAVFTPENAPDKNVT